MSTTCIAAATRRFSTPPLTHGDITAIWTGVRPLVAQAGKGASEISRKDEVWEGPAGVLTIAGGKLTAYRMMAERIADMAQETLGHKPTPCRTALDPLVGGDVDPAAAIALHGERLVGLYGSEAGDVTGGPAAEARHAVTHEGALTLEDCWVRRAAHAWFDADAGAAALHPAADAMAALLGWDAARTAAEIAVCQSHQLAAASLATA